MVLLVSFECWILLVSSLYCKCKVTNLLEIDVYLTFVNMAFAEALLSLFYNLIGMIWIDFFELIHFHK